MRRKSWLIAAGLIGLLFGQLALAGGSPIWAEYVQGPKFTITNKSGFPDNQVNVILVGIPNSAKKPHGDDDFHRINWNTKEFPVISTADNTVPIGATSYADYSTTLDKLSQDQDGNRYFYLPKAVDQSIPSSLFGIGSTRIYFSHQKPVYLRVISSNSLAQPNITNTSDPNFATFFDWFELAVDIDGTFHGNTTNVDFTGMPILFEVKNASETFGPTGMQRSRREIYQAFESYPVSFWGKLVTPTRIVAPGHGMDLGIFPVFVMSNYIYYCWDYWSKNTLRMYYLGTWWEGGVAMEDPNLPLVLTGLDGPHKDEIYLIYYPHPKDVFLCNGNLGGTSDTDKSLKNQVASALNRHVFHLAPYTAAYPAHPTEFPWGAYAPPSGAGGYLYYQANGLVDDPNIAILNQWNTYSQLLHQLSYNGKIYGFAYDDNNHQSDSLDVAAATEIRVTINNCLLPVITPVLNLLLD
jgi:hypothetical protein